MADNKNKVTLKWDPVNKVWVPQNFKRKFGISEVAMAVPVAGALAPALLGVKDRSYNVTADLFADPNVEIFDDYQGDQIVGTTAVTTTDVLAKYNSIYAPAVKPDAMAQAATAAETIARQRGGALPATPKGPKRIQKVTAVDFGNRLQGKTTEEPGAPKTSVYYTIQDVESRGQVVSDPNTGASTFKFQLVAPGVVQPSGEPMEDMLDAVLLPGPNDQPTGHKYYVEYLPNAVANIVNRYDKNKQLPQLKKMLYEAGYLSASEYTDSTYGANADIADVVTKNAIAASAVETSIKNYSLLQQKRYTPVSFEDELKDRFQPSGATQGKAGMPSLSQVDVVLDNEYMRFYNRKATPEEKASFRAQIQQAAVDNVQKVKKSLTSTGEAVDLTMGDSIFDETDIQELAIASTRGSGERKAYYGAQQFADALRGLSNKNFGASSFNLGDVLQ
jgi:hypothetical protein